VLEDFDLGMGTSVASAQTAETVFEIMKCIADVDMLPRGCMGSKCVIFMFFNSGYQCYFSSAIHFYSSFYSVLS